MAERLLAGHPAAPGVAVGGVWRPAAPRRADHVVDEDARGAERDAAASALARTGEELEALAERLGGEQGDIVRAGALMAADPALLASVEDLVRDRGRPAAEAILEAAGAYADAIAALGDPVLAARADDVRSLGRRAAAHATPDDRGQAGGGPRAAPAGEAAILLADDLGPADVAELPAAIVGVALAGSAPTAHAAIVARSLGLPLATGLGPEALALDDGTLVALDGEAGTLLIDPEPEHARAMQARMQARQRARARDEAERELPAQTRDGTRLGVLVNVAGTAEVAAGLRAGAEGIGLLRTELGFMEATSWPTEAEHVALLHPILSALGERPAIVRVLDFGADKAPPFLRGTPERGVALLLAHRDAFAAQLRAIARVAAGRDVRVLLPLVDAPEQVRAARELLDVRGLPVGAMIETPAAARAAAAIAAASDFLSIGTNDLTAATLQTDRFSGAGACSHDPRVLAHIGASVAAARGAGLRIEVCGEAASDPVMLPLLVGLGVDDVSVGAARVGLVRRWIRALQADAARALAREALALPTAGDVVALVEPSARELRSVELGDAVGETVHGGGRLLAFGA